MRIEVLSISRGYYNYGCDNANRAENVNSPAFKSLLYNPKSIIHKTNPVLQFIDDFFSRSVVASRRTWHKPIKEIQPHLQVIDIKDKKHPHVRMWDINDAEKTKYAVVLHGLSHNITSLQDMYKKILTNTEYAVLAPEYHGLTPDNNEDIYLEPRKILRDIKNSIAYLNQKGIKNEDITLIGHSFGGYAAAKLAKVYPDLESVILVSSINTNEYLSRKLQENRFRHIPKSIKEAYAEHPWLGLPLKFVFNTSRQLKKVTSPVDIIHANRDKLTDINISIDMAYHCKNLRSLNIIDGYHQMDENKMNTIVSILNSNNDNNK